MEIPPAVPVMTLPEATLFPEALMPLYIFEPRYRRMLAESLQGGRMFAVAMQRPDRRRQTPCTVAGLGLVRVAVDHADGTSHLILEGLARVELGPVLRYRPYRVQAIRPLRTQPADRVAVEALVSKVHELAAHRLRLGAPAVPAVGLKADGRKGDGLLGPALSLQDLLKHLRSIRDAALLADLVSCVALREPTHRQTILETVEVEPRLRRLIQFLLAEIEQHCLPSN